MSSKGGAFKESEAACGLRVASGPQEFLEWLIRTLRKVDLKKCQYLNIPRGQNPSWYNNRGSRDSLRNFGASLPVLDLQHPRKTTYQINLNPLYGTLS